MTNRQQVAMKPILISLSPVFFLKKSSDVEVVNHVIMLNIVDEYI